MAIWGKLIGGAAGFAIGGPLGALIGAAAGHAVDRMRDSAVDVTSEDAKPTAFTIAVIALSAKMAKADGQVTRDEIDAFKKIFHVPPEEAKNVGRVFDLARKDSRGFEPYARQVAKMFSTNPAVLEELLDALFYIAKADKVVHPAEIEYLRQVAHIFGFDDATFARIRASHIGRDAADPYAVLGVPHDAEDDDVRSAYRRLIRENHPDRLIAQGMPQDFIDVATDKVAAINAAYDSIKRQRNLS
jgi:DnaJ like chaperone protein